ncbi:hypothetical protein AB9X29_003722 [Vibrio vulnificus]
MLGCGSAPSDPVYSALYQYDRTLSLDDIAPVIPAYLARPYQQCDAELMLKVGIVEAVIDSNKGERVYVVRGEKCVLE